jgi:hypothetical protein
MQKFAHPLREREGKYTLGKAGPAAYARLAGVWAVPQAPFEEFRFHFCGTKPPWSVPSRRPAGHVSPKMHQHYSHVRLEAKRDALDALTMVNGKERRGTRIRWLRHKQRHNCVPDELYMRQRFVLWWS